MKVRPLQDRVLVRRVAEEEKTKGGIIIPDTAKEKPAEGEVVAVGNGKADDKGKVRRKDHLAERAEVQSREAGDAVHDVMGHGMQQQIRHGRNVAAAHT